MNEEERVLLMIRGLVASLPDDQQQLVRERAEQLRAVLGEDEIGSMALAIVGAERSAAA